MISLGETGISFTFMIRRVLCGLLVSQAHSLDRMLLKGETRLLEQILEHIFYHDEDDH